MSDQPPNLTILGQCGVGLRLVAENVRCYEWEAYEKSARRERKSARERLGPLKPQHKQTPASVA
jgi:hypothetical protein